MYKIDLEQERLEILKRYRLIFKSFRVTYSKEDLQNIRKAFTVAMNAHKDVRRKSGEPYIYHPLEVAHICLSEIGLGATSVICALLHDVVEDTDYTLADIELLFGKTVAKIIDGLTKIDDIFEQGTLSVQAENFKKMLLTLSDDVRVILIKLADRLHNMRTLDAMPPHKQVKIASETLYMYAPLAHRLGLYSIKGELEDLAMKYLEPNIYKEIEAKVAKTADERNKFITDFIAPINNALKDKPYSYALTSRVKSIKSIWEKMQKKSIPFDEVYDLFAIRIIIDIPFEKEKIACWDVYSEITNIYKPKPDRLRDWISNPKSNGYETLHTTVMSNSGKWVEVQIRTKRMDEIAENGYAAHWRYKNEGVLSTQENGLDEWLEKIREILKSAADSTTLDFLSDFKLTLFHDEIFVYTPKGELKNLPAGSTVLDFAYNIHSEIGNSVIGGKVNHKLVPLDYKLNSGDQVEVITSKKQKPSDEWLSFAHTARAKSHIKQFIKEEKRKFYDIGKSMLINMLTSIHIEKTPENIEKIKSALNYDHRLNLYYDIAKGIITEERIKECFKTSVKDDKSFMYKLFHLRKKDNDTNLHDIIQQQVAKRPETLMLGDTSASNQEIKYHTSDCCNPIPGDDVIGIVMPKEGIIVHRTNCPVAIQLMSQHGNDIVKAKWKVSGKVTFLTGFRISGVDRKGMIADIIKIITDESDINMRSFNMESSEGAFEGTITLYINNTGTLNDIIEKIRKVMGVKKVIRMN